MNTSTGKPEQTTELYQELLINHVNDVDPIWVSSANKMKHYGLQYQHDNYNKRFWDNYNVIKETPLDKKIVKDLEEYGALEEQFKDN